MSGEGERSREGFLARWSRMKSSPAEETGIASPAAQPVAPAAAAETEAPTLPPVEELTIDSDFRGFFHPKVDEGVRRAALRKLFSDPHFNVMDGLDVYIDDYSKADPIPPEMLAGLMQAKRIFRWAEGKDDEKDGDETAAPELSSEMAPAVSVEASPAEEPAAALPVETQAVNDPKDGRSA